MVNTTQDVSTLLTKEGAAVYLNVSYKSIERLVAKGEIKAIYVGKAIRFKKEDLDSRNSSNIQTA